MMSWIPVLIGLCVAAGVFIALIVLREGAAQKADYPSEFGDGEY
jgi:hypothetical protein